MPTMAGSICPFVYNSRKIYIRNEFIKDNTKTLILLPNKLKARHSGEYILLHAERQLTSSKKPKLRLIFSTLLKI
jgi:hypothetical protein